MDKNITLEESKEIIKKLVEKFDKNIAAYKKLAYKEEDVKIQFINPFFEALGWDVRNKSGAAPQYRDVFFEDSIKTAGGGTKAPDYCFTLAGRRMFFVEAKKPSVDIKKDINPAFQLRRYAWSAKLPMSILTDFEEFAVYESRKRPKKEDKASTERVIYVPYTKYLESWEEIFNRFSKKAVLEGALDQFIEESKKKRGTQEVDAEFLKEIEGWREELAKNIAVRNLELSVQDLNYVVQRTIDRIIFLRMCEDRGIEKYGQLKNLVEKENIYDGLCKLYKKADDKYNSGLFHFKKEKGRHTHPDELSLCITIDDKILKRIMKNMYYPDCPYEFSVLSPEILGNVYEQFLGKVIRLTAGHHAKIEEKPEVKKAGGVYYTPQYIVDYIVENTVGKLCKGKSPKQISDLRILDPACGSGSFLLGAYSYLLKFHLDYYSKYKNPKQYKDQVYQGASEEWHLTIKEKKRILLNNIYGVDIDHQAVEVTKLSLLLKVLEGESQDNLAKQATIDFTGGKKWRERALPDLSDTIKCGNSLIGPDFYEQTTLDDEESTMKINAFDWNAEFEEIMEAGGFDAVIGNPPYVRQEGLGEIKDYFKKYYQTYHGMADLYTYFIEKGVNLLNDTGLWGNIVANKWMRANYGTPLRKWLKENHIVEILDFGDLRVFTTATTYPCIMIVGKGKPVDKFNVVNFKTLEPARLNETIQTSQFKVKVSGLDDSGWALINERDTQLLDKIKMSGKPLGEYGNERIYRGIVTGLNEAFLIDDEKRSQLVKKDKKCKDIIKPFLIGKNLNRYTIKSENIYLIFTRRGIKINEYPSIKEYLTKYKEQLTPKPKNWKGGKWQGRKSGSYEWYEIQDSTDYYEEFEKQKICWGNLMNKGSFTFDDRDYYINAPACIGPAPP